MSVAGARRRQRFETQALQIARTADIPRIGNDETPSFVELVEGLALVGNGRTRAGHDTLIVSVIVALVIVAGHESLRHALVFHRRLEHHAVAELIDHGALDLLPRRLTRRIAIAAVLFQ